MDIKSSIIIPCYNEALNIPHIFEKVRSIVEAESSIEFVLVDNGSSDDSNKLLHESAQQVGGNQVQIVHVEVNKGYGYGILQGLKAARGEVLGWTHADLQTDLQDVVRAIKVIQDSDQSCIVKGKRRKRKVLDTFFTWGMQKFASFSLGVKFSDVNAQPKMFKREFYDLHFSGAPYDFSLDLYLLYTAIKNNIPVKEIPVEFLDRLYGEAKGGGGSSLKTRYKLIKRTANYILELKKSVEVSNG